MTLLPVETIRGSELVCDRCGLGWDAELAYAALAHQCQPPKRIRLPIGLRFHLWRRRLLTRKDAA